MHNIVFGGYTNWNPSADDLTGPRDCVLRGDNLVWDEEGQLALRRGVTDLFPQLPTAILSLYTADVQGSRLRLQGGNDGNVYRNGVPVTGPFNGQGDIVFGGAMGQVFMTRGTVKKKWDGSTSAAFRNWGIVRPSSAPTVTVSPGAITPIELHPTTSGWQAWEGILQNTADHTGAANQALACTVNSGTNRAGASRYFTTPQDFSGNPEDVIEFWIKSSAPNALVSVQLSFDVSNFGAPFAEDVYWYEYTFDNNVAPPTDDTFLRDDPNAEGDDRRRILQDLQNPAGVKSRITPAVAANQWVKISAPRSAFERVGGATGRDWSTVVAIQVIAQFEISGSSSATTTSQLSMSFDGIEVTKGRLTGSYYAKVVFVNSQLGYVAKSGPSEASPQVTVKAGNLTVSIPSTSDSQVNEAWVYLLGGTLDRYYRFAVGSPGQSITTAKSEREALIDNITLDRWNEVPPGDIIDILDGLHYGRLLVLTEDQLYVSRPYDPDHFGTNQQIKVGEASGGGERNLWIKRTIGGVFIGTTRDIYRLEGTGDELDGGNGVIGFQVIPCSVESPPMGQGTYPLGAVRAVDAEGHTLVYWAMDGPREFNGVASVPLRGNLDLLLKWRDRYGVQKIDFQGRIRLALNFGLLYVMVSEGTASQSVPTIYRLDMKKGKDGWSRYTFSGPRNVTTLYKERAIAGSAGSIVMAGSENGHVMWLDSCDAVDGAEGALPVVVLPPISDNQQPFHRKDAMDLQVSFEADTNPLTVELYLDRKALPAVTYQATAQKGERQAWRRAIVGMMDPFIRVQPKLSGMFTKFRLYHVGISYRLRPQLALARDTGYMDLSNGDLVWIRQAYVRLWAPVTALGLRVIAYLDGVMFEAAIVPEKAEVIKYRVDFGRAAKGTQLRVLVMPLFKDAVGRTVDPVPAPPTPDSSMVDSGQRIDEFSRMDQPTNPDSFRRRGVNVGFNAQTGGDSGRLPDYPTGFFDGSEAVAFELYDIRVQIRQSGNWTEKLIFKSAQPEERNG